jgi:hypothetical protein
VAFYQTHFNGLAWPDYYYHHHHHHHLSLITEQEKVPPLNYQSWNCGLVGKWCTCSVQDLHQFKYTIYAQALQIGQAESVIGW